MGVPTKIYLFKTTKVELFVKACLHLAKLCRSDLPSIFWKTAFKLFTFSKYIISSVKDDLARCRLGYASTAICDIALILLMQTSNISFMNEMKNTLRIFILMYHSKNANSWIFFGMKMFHCFNMDFILVQLFIARFSSIYHFLSLFMLQFLIILKDCNVK